MSNSLQPVTGSISHKAKQDGVSQMDAITGIEMTLLIDSSFSMTAQDAGPDNNEVRFSVATREAAKLQEQYPGLWMVVSFSDVATVCYNGIPDFKQGGTNLKAALDVVLELETTLALMGKDVSAMTHFVTTDGAVDDENGALAVARKIRGTINAI